jgi:hypothetical protein
VVKGKLKEKDFMKNHLDTIVAIGKTSLGSTVFSGKQNSNRTS